MSSVQVIDYKKKYQKQKQALGIFCFSKKEHKKIEKKEK
jgi:hypothetical protein